MKAIRKYASNVLYKSKYEVCKDRCKAEKQIGTHRNASFLTAIFITFKF